MTILLALLGALGGWFPVDASVPATPEPPPRVLELAVVARVEGAAGAGAWTAEAWMGSAPTVSGPEAAPGECLRPRPAADAGAEGARSMRIVGTTGADLVWDARGGRYRSAGPKRAADAGWGVGDLRWIDRDGRAHVAEGVVRFGAVPTVRGVARDGEGNVHLRWAADPRERVEVHVNGPAGALVCGTAGDTVELPWWTVPARGGSVVLRVVRERVARPEGAATVRVRSVIERVVPLEGTSADGADAMPPAPPATPPKPRRVGFAARPTVG